MSSTRVELAHDTALVADIIRTSIVDGPGHRFVVFLQGCNFDCVACHNPQTIPGHAAVDGHEPRRWTVDELLDEIRQVVPFIRGVTVSGGEATQQPAFLASFFDAIHNDPQLRHLTCFVDSNGACDLSTWDALAPVMDGAMIDLKCFDPAIHERMTGESNDRVLASIDHLHRRGLLSEVRLLMIAGVNDGPDLLRRTGLWLASTCPGALLKVIGFRLHGTRAQDPPLDEPTAEQLLAVADILRSAGAIEIQIV